MRVLSARGMDAETTGKFLFPHKRRGSKYMLIRGRRRAAAPARRQTNGKRRPKVLDHLAGLAYPWRRDYNYLEELVMPSLHIYVPGEQPAKARTAFLEAATQAVVDSLATPLPSVRIMLHEMPAAQVMVGGRIGVPAVTCHVHLIAGRTEAQKAALFSAMTQAAQSCLNVPGEEVRVILHDIPATDMGMANGASAKSLGR